MKYYHPIQKYLFNNGCNQERTDDKNDSEIVIKAFASYHVKTSLQTVNDCNI